MGDESPGVEQAAFAAGGVSASLEERPVTIGIAWGGEEAARLLNTAAERRTPLIQLRPSGETSIGVQLFWPDSGAAAAGLVPIILIDEPPDRATEQILADRSGGANFHRRGIRAPSDSPSLPAGEGVP